MGRPMEPDVVAIRAINRALEPLDKPTRRRVLEYVAAGEFRQPQRNLIELERSNARMAECLRWLYGCDGVYTPERSRIEGALS